MKRRTCTRNNRCKEETCPDDCANWEDNHVRVRTLEKKLACRLTDEELLRTGQELTESYGEMREVEKEEAAIKQQYKAKKGELESRIERLCGLLSSKTEQRDVRCEEVKNFAESTISLTRMDTGDQLEHKEMTTDETQQHFALEEEPAKASPDEGEDDGDDTGEVKPDMSALIEQARTWVVETGKASTASIQRQFRVGFMVASQVMDALQDAEVIGPATDGNGPREVLVKK